MHSKTCPKCQGTLAEGFVIAEKHGMPTVASWAEGTPTKGWWGDVKVIGKPIPIATWRCQRCGFLENYAKR